MTSVLRHPHAPQPPNRPLCPPCSCLKLSPSILSDKNRQIMTSVSMSSTRASEPSSLWKSTYPYPASYCLKLSKAHNTDSFPDMYLLHCLSLFYKWSTEGTHSGFLLELARLLFNLPYFVTVSASFSVLSAGFS